MADVLEGMNDEARRTLHAAARAFVDHLDSTHAVNFVEITMVDENGNGACVVSIGRIGAENPVEQRMRLRTENEALRRQNAALIKALSALGGDDADR